MFVWNNPEPVHYSGTILFAVAETEDQARIIIKEKCIHFTPSSLGEYFDPGYEIEIGKPDAIYDLPCAAIYSWEE